MFFFFLQGKMSHPKNQTRFRGFSHPRAPDRHRPRNWSKPVHTYLKGWNMIR